MGNFLPSHKRSLILRSYPMACKLFYENSGTATDIFTNNISLIVVTITKLGNVTRFHVCTIVVSIYIRYWCFGNICNKEVCSDSFRWGSAKILRPFGNICQHTNQEISKGIFFNRSSVENCGGKFSTFWILCFLLLNLETVSCGAN